MLAMVQEGLESLKETMGLILWNVTMLAMVQEGLEPRSDGNLRSVRRRNAGYGAGRFREVETTTSSKHLLSQCWLWCRKV